MRLSVKNYLKRLLFGNESPKTFPAIRVDEGRFSEKVFLKCGAVEYDITQTHSIVCHRPFLMAAWMSHVWLTLPETSQFAVVKRSKGLCAMANLTKLDAVQLNDNVLVVFSIMDASCYQVGHLRQWVLHRYFKNKDTIAEGKIYAALYSYPRRVIIVSFKEENYYNIFPMDFHCFNNNGGLLALGLRATNITVQKAVLQKKLVISDSGSIDLKTIYELGKNHSRVPPALNDLPFAVVSSITYGFPVPASFSYYKEIEIIETRQLGTHRLLIGKVLNHVESGKTHAAPVSHISFFQSVISNYEPAK